MVLVQSAVESAFTYFAVFWVLHWLDVPDPVANALALIAIVASPAVLSRVVMDTHASGPVTDRALSLATLNTFYALTLGYAQAGLIERAPSAITERIYPVLVVLGLSFVVGAALALAMRSALRVMSPTSENTSILLLGLIAAGAAVSAHLGGSAPLAALIGGIMLKQLNPRPWSWPQQLGTAASLLTMLMFVLVSIVAAQADWSLPVASLVLALIRRPRRWPRWPAWRWPIPAVAPAGSRRCWSGLRDGAAVFDRPADRVQLRHRIAAARRTHHADRPAGDPADGSVRRGDRHRCHPCRRRRLRAVDARGLQHDGGPSVMSAKNAGTERRRKKKVTQKPQKDFQISFCLFCDFCETSATSAFGCPFPNPNPGHP